MMVNTFIKVCLLLDLPWLDFFLVLCCFDIIFICEWYWIWINDVVATLSCQGQSSDHFFTSQVRSWKLKRHTFENKFIEYRDWFLFLFLLVIFAPIPDHLTDCIILYFFTPYILGSLNCKKKIEKKWQ